MSDISVTTTKTIRIKIGSDAGELYYKLLEFPDGHPYGWTLYNAWYEGNGIVLVYIEDQRNSDKNR